MHTALKSELGAYPRGLRELTEIMCKRRSAEVW